VLYAKAAARQAVALMMYPCKYRYNGTSDFDLAQSLSPPVDLPPNASKPLKVQTRRDETEISAFVLIVRGHIVSRIAMASSVSGSLSWPAKRVARAAGTLSCRSQWRHYHGYHDGRNRLSDLWAPIRGVSPPKNEGMLRRSVDARLMLKQADD
jgi:hypothetical protein